MKKLISIVFLSTFLHFSVNAQKALKLGENPGSIDPSAILELQSSPTISKGLLLPRVDLTANPVTNPANGLMVYNTNLSNPGIYVYTNTGWSYLASITSLNLALANYQPLNSVLTSFGNLSTSSSGWLYNNNGTFSYKTLSVSDLSGILGIANGGTGAVDAISARANLGLGNVDNTSDATKPLSAAAIAALALKQDALNGTGYAKLSGTSLTFNPTIPNTDLANSAIIINGKTIALGDNTTISSNTSSALTFDNLGSGAASGTTFDGSTPQTISYNTIGAVGSNGLISAGQGIKVSWDEKGLVTGYDPLVSTADIPHSTNRRYMTDAQFIKFGDLMQTKGINNGDQTITLQGDVTGSSTGVMDVTLSPSGVTAGDYTNANISVDGKGRITLASSSTLDLNTITGVLPISKGGTNASDLVTARTNLGLGTAAVKNEAFFAPAAGSSSITTIGTLLAGSIPYSLITGAPSQIQSDWNAVIGSSAILNKPILATVATSGRYTDLSNLPTIPAAQVQSDWNAVSGLGVILNKPVLATVATSGSYTDLSNKPTIDAAAVGLGNVNNTSDANKPVSTATQTALNLKANSSSLALVATSGLYSDLTGLPDLTLKANLASPTFTGTPAAPTVATTDNSTTIATTAFVKAAISASGSGVSSITGTANQVIASASTGVINLSLPQNINNTATPTFGGATLNGATSVSGTLTGTGGITTTGASMLSFGADATGQNINLGTGGAAKLIAIGSTSLASSLTEKVGTGNYLLDGVGASTYSIGGSTTNGTISIGGSAQTGSITIGSSTGTNTVNISNGTGTSTLNLGTGTNSFGTNNINIGSTAQTNNATNIKSTITNIATSNSVDQTVNIGTGSGNNGGNSITIGNINSNSVTLATTTRVSGNFSINTNKFNVTASSGNTTIAGTLGVTGNTTLGGTLTITNGLGTNLLAANGGVITAGTGITISGGTISSSGGISLTSLSATSPLSYNNTTGAFSIPAATTSANGYLSSADWNTFNGKQSAITTSANLATALSDETGTGSVVFSTSPTLVSPAIGAATGTSLNLSGSVTAGSFVKSLGLASEILAANGTVITAGTGLSLSGGVLTNTGVPGPTGPQGPAGGGVTSVSGSGGTTGLTLNGGPITTSGTLTLGGILAIENGGTNATTAAAALTNLGAAPTASPTFTGTVTASGLNTAGIVTNTSGGVLGTSTFASLLTSNNVFGAPYSGSVTASGGGYSSIGSSTGTYTRIGNIVTVSININSLATNNTNGAITVSIPLPINANAGQNNVGVFSAARSGSNSLSGGPVSISTTTATATMNTTSSSVTYSGNVIFQYTL